MCDATRVSTFEERCMAPGQSWGGQRAVELAVCDSDFIDEKSQIIESAPRGPAGYAWFWVCCLASSESSKVFV